ncbi:MFS transporter [Synechococcus sp. PCC 7336]|uniref:MFS transporter n=1 Tax=Synechococcus sp. PCC 7336 TaxID=195250 RepID=UPI00034C4AAD|nr:MFS transporter [Synechococcus sp. PCC 7336]
MPRNRKTFEQQSLKLPVVLAAGSLTTMAGGVVAPVIPDVVQQLAIDPVLAGNLVSMHCLTIAVLSPPLGILADKIGPLNVLLPALVFYALFGAAGALMPSFWPLLATRALLGVASGGIAAGSLGLLGSIYEGEARSKAIAYAASILTITGIVFPLLGGWVGSFNWQFAFYLYGLALPLALLALYTFERKVPPHAIKAGSNEGLRGVLGRAEIQKLLLTLSLASVAMYAVVIYAPLYLRETLAIGTTLNGVALASRAVGAALVSAFGAKRLAKKWGKARATALGFGLMAVTLWTIPILSLYRWILLAAVLFGAGFGLVLPNLYDTLANLAPDKLRSSVLAAGTGAGFLGQFLSPILLGPVLAVGGLEWTFYAAGGVAIAAGFLLFVPATST